MNEDVTMPTSANFDFVRDQPDAVFPQPFHRGFGFFGTRNDTWWRPSPLLLMNFAMTEFSDTGSSSSIRLSPRGTITTRTCSASTTSSGETVTPNFS